jgi:uncharacterized protein YbjQ (UPF0145 family)
MKPTMNTWVEKFAFRTAIFFTFLLPILWVFVPISLSILLKGSIDDEQIDDVILTAAVIVFFGSCIFFPLMCIVCSIWIERTHFKALTEAENELSDIVVSSMKTLPPNWKPNGTIFLCENVVMANDYFKAILWTFRKIIGGRSRSFERLIERGRREATIRLLRKAKEFGANVVWNIRYETSIVRTNYSSAGKDRNSMAGIEMIAYGTAFFVTENK